MNRNKNGLPRNRNKKLMKEIKKGQLEPQIDELTLLHHQNIAGRNIPSFPKKITPKDKKLLLNSKRETLFKKSKNAFKHSKRTTPGPAISQSAPQFVHPEGARWIKTLNKQSILKKNLLNKKLSKKSTSSK